MSRSEERRQREEEIAEYLFERAHEEQLGQNKKRDRALSTMMVRENLHVEQLEGALQKVFEQKIVPPKFALKNDRHPKNRIVNVVLSDLHFGAMLDPKECPKAYGPEEEARSLAAVVKQVAEYKPQYRKESKLYIHLIGDIIQGVIHDLRSGRPLAEQEAIAIYLLSQAVAFLCGQYPEVELFCTPGNHGRNPHRHPERAVNQKWDSHEQTIYYAIKIALRGFKNLKVHLDKRPYYTWQAFDQVGVGTHGDSVINVGYPNRSIDVEKLRRQINEFNAGRQKGQHCDVVILGHVHTLSMFQLNSGPIVMTNGPLIPSDEYAISKGFFNAACAQWMFESVPGHIVGDARFITIDDAVRNDKTLEKIIKPFEGF